MNNPPEDVTTLADILIAGYKRGVFPMADAADDPDAYWVDPDQRGQLPIRDLHIPARLRRRVLQFPFRVTIDTAFDAVIDACAAATVTRPATWINGQIRAGFIELHRRGIAHSVEVWDGETLAGGLYGLALGRVFCGESMVSRATDASKIALVHLCARLHAAGFEVLDTQFINDHLRQFGVYEIPRAAYHTLLTQYAEQPADFAMAGSDEELLVRRYFAARGDITI